MTKCSEHHLEFSSPDHRLPITTHDLYFRPFDDCLRYDKNGRVTEDTKFSINHPALKIQNSKFIGSPDDKFETMLFLPEGENRKGEGGLRTKGYFKHSYKMVDGKWFITDSDNNPVVPAPDDIQSKIKQYLSSNAQYQSPITELPLITVITVVYNGAKYLEETILSVINQTYPNVEYIIIDGGSTDGTLGIIKKYEDYIDYWVSEKDKGIYDAMNKGITLCFGEIVGIINSDDYYQEDVFKTIIYESYFNNAEIIHGNLVLVNEELKLNKIIYPTLRKLKNRMSLNHPTCFIKRKLYYKKMFDINFKIAADYELLLYFYLAGKAFLYVDKTISFMRTGGASVNWHVIRRELFIIQKKYYGLIKATVAYLLYFIKMIIIKASKRVLLIFFNKKFLKKLIGYSKN